MIKVKTMTTFLGENQWINIQFCPLATTSSVRVHSWLQSLTLLQGVVQWQITEVQTMKPFSPHPFQSPPWCKSFTLRASRLSLHDNTPRSVSPSAPLSSAHCAVVIRSVAQRFQSQQHESALTFSQAAFKKCQHTVTDTHSCCVDACWCYSETALVKRHSFTVT